MTQITQTITPLPSPPDPSSDRPATFSSKAAAYAIAQKQMVDELNVWVGQVNQAVADVVGVDWPNLAAAAQGYRDQSASSAAQALGARDVAIAASQVAAAPTESLAALAQSIHSGNVVASFLYDVSKDSDGGASIKREQHTNWYNETICTGAWRQQLANLTAAWNVTGAAAGDFYQNTTDGKFYTIGGTKAAPTQVEVFRGNSRERPALALVVAEASRVVIYDATKPGCPMWMVCVGASGNFIRGSNYTSVAMVNGKLYVGSTQWALTVANFAADTIELYDQGAYYKGKANIAGRNSGTGYSVVSGAAGLVNFAVNSIAITILPDAPVDPATGLQLSTIAVATAGGVSVIQSSGSVVNSANTNNFTRVAIDSRNGLWGCDTANLNATYYGDIGSRGAAFSGLKSYSKSASSIPSLLGDVNNGHSAMPTKGTAIAVASALGLTCIQQNPATPTKGMVAYITNAYNTGWMVGDIRGAWLADTVAETVTGPELITNGTFDTNTSGWTVLNSATFVASGGVATLTNDATGTHPGGAYQAIATVPGRTYVASCDFIKGTAANGFLAASTTVGALDLGFATLTASGKLLFQFVASGATTYINVYPSNVAASITGSYDNISCRQAVPDRSVKAKGLAINGSVTKAPVATGAQLMGWGGYSAANTVDQPYNSDLDVATGDFFLCGWAQLSALGTSRYLAMRGRAVPAAGTWAVLQKGTGEISFYAHNGSAFTEIASTAAQAANALAFIAVWRSGSTLSISVNSGTPVTATFAATLTDTSATLRFGNHLDGTAPFNGSLALWRFAATAPSTDQIAQIYRDELALFQPGAQCTIDGTSTAVTALAYDDSTELLHIGTSWGRTAMRNLVRVESAATQVGAIQALSAGSGAHITAGALSGRYVQPAITLRDELRRKTEARRAATKEVITVDTDFIAGQTTYTLPYGFTTKNVWAAGAPKRIGSTKDYTVSFDGYRETITFNSAPGAVWVRIDMNRAN
jgi:hypothetical protein